MLPPEWLVEWTKYIGLVVVTIAAIKGLFGGARSLL